jgi:hypothetical protein
MPLFAPGPEAECDEAVPVGAAPTLGGNTRHAAFEGVARKMLGRLIIAVHRSVERDAGLDVAQALK